MPPENLRAQARAELTRPWAIMPAALDILTSYARGELSAEAAQQALTPSAAARRDQRTAGAVAVIPLRGIITPRGSFFSFLFGGGSGGLEGFQQSLREALADDDVGSILIDIDSPGGSVDLVDETAAMVRAARGTKPIVAIANTMAASAAYYIASQADEVIVTPSGMTGSIGVFCEHLDFSGMNEQMGVVVTLVSAGKFKTEGNFDEPLGAEARKAMQATVDAYYTQFVAAVAAGRNTTPKAVQDGYGQGRVLTAERSLAEGLVDRVESFDDTISRLLSAPPARAALPGALEPAAVPAAANPAAEPVANVTTPPAESEEAATPAVPPWLLFHTNRHARTNQGG